MTNISPTDRGRKLLERCALFSSLDEKARRDIAAYANPRNFGTGEPICRLGDRGDSMMAVIVGTVRISLPTTRGKEVILADLRAGELDSRGTKTAEAAAAEPRPQAGKRRLRDCRIS